MTNIFNQRFATLGVLTLLFFHAFAYAEQADYDVSDWGGVLQQYVDHQGLVNYEGLAKNRQQLDQYLAQIKRVGPTTAPQLFHDRAHQLAYYINAYNALVFEGVNGSTKSGCFDEVRADNANFKHFGLCRLCRAETVNVMSCQDICLE